MECWRGGSMEALVEPHTARSVCRFGNNSYSDTVAWTLACLVLSRPLFLLQVFFFVGVGASSRATNWHQGGGKKGPVRYMCCSVSE